MKIAFTSQNFRTITGHAGKCNRFLVIEQGPDGEPRESAHLDLPKELAFHNFAGGPHPIDGCPILVTQGCGGGFLQRMAARNVRVIVTGESDPFAAARAIFRGESLPLASAGHAHDQHSCGCGSEGT